MAVDHDHLHALLIRHDLQTSTRRLCKARSRVPANMKPYQGILMKEEWSPTPELNEEHPELEEDEKYCKMRSALLAFEDSQGWSADAQSRAFFKTLRSTLHAIVSQADAAKRRAMVAAAHAWFEKSLPSGGAGRRIRVVDHPAWDRPK
eukprot:evm.model.scf_1490.3 EVM.evm.TU.scf_1490.3   scf_1490:34939-37146(+)